MSGSVLIAGSTSTTRIKLASEFQSASYVVLSASTGTEAAEAIASQKPDVAVLDSALALETAPENRRGAARRAQVTLPPRETLCQRLLKGQPTCPVIVLCNSGREGRPQRVQALRAGAAEVFSKDVHPSLLMAGVRRAIRGHIAAEEASRTEVEGRALGLSEAARALDYPGKIGWIQINPDRNSPILSELKGNISDAIIPISVDRVMRAVSQSDPGVKPMDVLVLDAGQPGQKAAQQTALRLIPEIASRSGSTHPAIVLILPQGFSPLMAAQAYDLGAAEVLSPNCDLEEITLRLRRQVASKQRRDALNKGMRKGMRLAATDSLTGLYNRRYAMTHLNQVLQYPAKPGLTHAVLMLDLDHFKQVNDTHGHATGDAVLIETARILQANMRGRDLLARIGGEEFLVVMPDIPPGDINTAADRLRDALAAAEFTPPGKAVPVLRQTVSIGVAAPQPGGPHPQAEDLIRQADHALYRAKAAGRNKVAVSLPARLNPRKRAGLVTLPPRAVSAPA
ncbi:diguanylate cyclase [Alphaproteobacteria bacterium KMM 3653]|uniref:diguanylate cyclase n=1 Tax=Harenicola maris TaxID=2841044 RepID=A0AAP2G9A3_9RHOB|nr:diguanylate cyclase [Harenicola maris]